MTAQDRAVNVINLLGWLLLVVVFIVMVIVVQAIVDAQTFHDALRYGDLNKCRQVSDELLRDRCVSLVKANF